MPGSPRPTRRRLFVTAGALPLASFVSATASARLPARAIDFTGDVPANESASGTPDADADSDSNADSETDSNTDSSDACEGDEEPRVELFVAVVDRIVDGEHVVLLLEDGDELVDQHVEPVDSFETVAERDVLFVALDGDALLGYRRLEERPRMR